MAFMNPTNEEAGAPDRVLQRRDEGSSGGLADPRLVEELEASLARLQAYADGAWSRNTVRAYQSDWEQFSTWCSKFDRSPLPCDEETLGLYLGSVAPQLSLATLERRLSSISAVHRQRGYPNPATVSEGPLMMIWRGIVRDKSRRQDKAEPLMAKDLRSIVQNLPRESDTGDLTTRSLRDRALLLIGWAGALRRSELANLSVEDVQFVSGEGLNIEIRKSKSDQEGYGLTKGIPYGTHVETCPVTALRTWLQAADIKSGPVFRRFYKGGKIGRSALSPQSVSLILKSHAERVGLSPDDFSAHSLRSGFITQAIRAGKSERRVKEHSGHKSWETFNGYVKQAATFTENPAKDIGI